MKLFATILALDVPPGSSFGIDCVSFTCGEKFQGVKMIPPGLHLVSVGAGGNDHARVSEFVRLGGGDVAVFRWDPATETFAPGSGMDDDEADRFRAGARNHDFDRTTGPNKRCGDSKKSISSSNSINNLICNSWNFIH